MRPQNLAWLLVLVAMLAAAQTPVATIGTEKITEEELMQAVEGQLRQLRTQEFDLKNRTLENLILRRLLDAEAKRAGMTLEALLDREVDSKVPQPSDAEVEAFYLGQRDRVNRPFDQVKAQMQQTLRSAKLQSARQQYFAALRAKAGVKVLLSPPRTQVSFDPQRLRGNPQAPVTIVEFSDFQCPYCQKAHETVKEVLKKYEGAVRFAYRDLPLREIHAHAQAAAEASRCAGDQGKFWEYHDLLYTNPSKIDPAGMTELAQRAGLEPAAFETCLKSGKYRDAVGRDLDEARRLGVNSTPSFFVNGIQLSGAVDISEFERLIDAELALKK